MVKFLKSELVVNSKKSLREKNKKIILSKFLKKINKLILFK